MKKIAILFIVVLLQACNSDDEETTLPPFQSNDIEFAEIGKGALYGIGVENIPQSNLVINTLSDWQSLVAQMNSYNNVSDSFSDSLIDFQVKL